jgi:hypothetical protein
MTASIAHLKIKLDEVKPAVVRRVEVPLTIRLDRLHLVLQAAMGWTNSHLYEIRARDIGWGVPDPDFGDGPLDARKARLGDVLEDAGVRSLKYLYDFGDGWEHSIRIERNRGGSRHCISAPGRSERTVPTGGRRRSLGLPRLPRSDRRSRPRTACRERDLGRRRVRSGRPRCREARQ